ncbi:MAG: cupredoxin domain-containing protein [Chloroflexi bacterium]|nr:cupredoxin domain-containing protein [Chloroflexota bacterium]
MFRRKAVSFKIVSAFLLCGALLTGAAVTAFAQAAQTFSVRLVPFEILGAPPTVRAGASLVFNATTEGNHNLAIDGNGVDLQPSTPNLRDTSGTISFRALQPGTYNLYCPVGNHRERGMQVRFTVVAGAVTGPGGTAVGLPRTGGAAGVTGAASAAGAALPIGLAIAGLASGAAGIILRRRAT